MFITDQRPKKRGKYNCVNENVKEIILEEFKAGGDFISIAERLGVKQRTAYHICKLSKTKNLPRGGTRKKCVKVTPEIKHSLMAFLEQNNDATLSEMRDHVKRAVSISTINNILDRSLITTKQLRPKPVGQDTPENLQKRKYFAGFYLKDHGARVHIDESNYNLFTRRSMGRAPRGQRAFKTQRNSRGKNINILLAIDDTRIIHYVSVVGSSKDIFKSFMTGVSKALEDVCATIYIYG